jgi:hypothetical protein
MAGQAFTLQIKEKGVFSLKMQKLIRLVAILVVAALVVTTLVASLSSLL